MLSSPYSPSSPTLSNAQQARQPRAIVLINGFNVIWEDIRIVTTTFYVADSYRVEIPLTHQPNGFDISYLSSQSQLTVQIFVGFPLNPSAFTTSDLDLLMYGDCDEMDIDPLQAKITFSGRDLTSRLIDKKTYSKYPNQTASTIATQLAQAHGLMPVVTPTKGNVGTFYNQQNTVMTKETTEWDLLTFLAQQSNFVTYVQGQNLYFGPAPTINNTTPYLLNYQPPSNVSGSPIFNGMRLNMFRSFTVSKDVTVKVRTPYSPLTGRAFTKTAGKTNKSINSANAGNQTYVFTYPGLTPDQASSKAQQLLQEITLNELRIEALLPGDNKLLKSSLIKLVGTNSHFDQYYFTDTIVRNINVYEGYTMDIKAKNQDVNSEVIL